jgi:hypothetical protein
MKNIIISACVSGLLAFSFTASAGSPQSIRSQPASISMSKVQAQDAMRGEVALRLAPIRSLSDLHDYMAAHARTRTPLDALSPTAKRVFLDSLSFNEKGVTSFNYAILEDELTASQAYKILGLFGVERLTSKLHNARVVSDTDRLIMSNMSVQPATCGGGGTTTSTGMCDHDDYRCISRATCMSAMSMICTSNC